MLISYQREDSSGPKLSTYTIATTEVCHGRQTSLVGLLIPTLLSPLQTPAELKSILTRALGQLGEQM